MKRLVKMLVADFGYEVGEIAESKLFRELTEAELKYNVNNRYHFDEYNVFVKCKIDIDERAYRFMDWYEIEILESEDCE